VCRFGISPRRENLPAEPTGLDPYRVAIMPKWKALGRDYGICDPSKVEEIDAAIPENKRRESVVASGLSFTVLTPKLVYGSTFGTFSRMPDWRTHLEEFRNSSEFLDWPVFYIRRSRPGEGKEQTLALELGLELPANDPGKRPSTPVAYVPEILFFPYSNPQLYWDSSDYEKIKQRIHREADRFGWT
jgi:hypothetical protein